MTLFLKTVFFFFFLTSNTPVLVIWIQSNKITLFWCFCGPACVHIANISTPSSVCMRWVELWVLNFPPPEIFSKICKIIQSKSYFGPLVSLPPHLMIIVTIYESIACNMIDDITASTLQHFNSSLHIKYMIYKWLSPTIKFLCTFCELILLF